MFYQAEDITLYLSPYDLSEQSGAEALAGDVTISPTDLLHLAQLALDARADQHPQTYDFLVSNSLLSSVDESLSALREKLSMSIDARLFDLNAVYNLGVKSFNSGQIEDAVNTFGIQASHPRFGASALSALAACACLQEEFATALIFAQEGIACHETHPRAYLIAGYCALRSGDPQTAKRHFALATRLARGDSRFRNVQRCAQRELLLMQLA